MGVVIFCCCWDISSSFTPALRWFWCQHCFLLCSRENIQSCWFSLYYKGYNISKDGASTASHVKLSQCLIILRVKKNSLRYKHTSAISSHLVFLSSHGGQEGDKWAALLPYPCAVAQAPSSCSLVLLIHLPLALTLETRCQQTFHQTSWGRKQVLNFSTSQFELRNIEAVKNHQQPKDKMYGLAGLPQHCDHLDSIYLLPVSWKERQMCKPGDD